MENGFLKIVCFWGKTLYWLARYFIFQTENTDTYTYSQQTVLKQVFDYFFKVIKVKEDKEKFEVTLDVSQYKPEELKVSTVNNVLSIEGKHEEEVKLNLN